MSGAGLVKETTWNRTMSCLDVNRILLAAPRERTASDVAHIFACTACGLLAAASAELDRKLERALAVPVPDSLADRILLGHHWRRRRKLRMMLAAASVLPIAGLVLALLYRPPQALQTVGEKHPAVAAIAEVVRESERAGPPGPRVSAQDDLRRAGLNLPAAEGRAEYVGECHIAGSTACEHIVVTTPRDQANVLLVPGLPPAKRLLVADRRMVALMNAAPAGGFIVVAASAESATRVETLLLRSPVEPVTTIVSTEAP